MQLSDLFTNLSYGALSNLAIGGQGSGTIPEQHHARLLNLTNQGLKALHRRFPLLEKEVVFRTYGDITLYPLRRIYADTDTTAVQQKFIADSRIDPFLEDVMKIIGIFDEAGCPVGLNDPEDPCSFSTPDFDTLQTTAPVDGAIYTAIYWANHPLLVPSLGEVPVDLNQSIILPPVLEPALAAYIAYQIFSPMAGQEMSAKAMEHLQFYEAICTEIADKDLVSTSTIESNHKFNDRGFA